MLISTAIVFYSRTGELDPLCRFHKTIKVKLCWLINEWKGLIVFVCLFAFRLTALICVSDRKPELQKLLQITANVFGILIQSSWWMLTTISRPLSCVSLRTLYMGFYRVWVDVTWGFMFLSSHPFTSKKRFLFLFSKK